MNIHHVFRAGAAALSFAALTGFTLVPPATAHDEKHKQSVTAVSSDDEKLVKQSSSPSVIIVNDDDDQNVTPKKADIDDNDDDNYVVKSPKHADIDDDNDDVETTEVETPRIPKVETPKYETPVIPKVETPKYETPPTPVIPKVETPKFETPPTPVIPKVETPEYDTPPTPVIPKVETPEYETPKVPKVETPHYETPKVEKIETPHYETPKVEKVETPKIETPRRIERIETTEVETPEAETEVAHVEETEVPVMLIGCLQPEKGYHDGHWYGKGDDFVLLHAMKYDESMVLAYAAQSCANATGGYAYRLRGHDHDNLAVFSGRRVIVTGELEDNHTVAMTGIWSGHHSPKFPKLELGSVREFVPPLVIVQRVMVERVAEAPPAPTPPIELAPAPMPEPAPVGTAGIEEPRKELPKTASPIPFIGLIGLISIATALGVRVLRRA